MHLFRRPLPAKTTLILMHNLGVTLGAGIPLVVGLSLVERQSRALAPVVRHLKREVERGGTLASAMESSPRRFPPIVASLVRAGEMSGSLQLNVEAVTEHLRKSIDLTNKIRSAMLYPCFVLVALAGMGLAIGTFVLPQLIPLFESLDVRLPLSTRVLLWLAVFFQNHGGVFSVSSVAGAVLGFRLLRSERLRPFVDRVLLRVPLVCDVQRNALVAQMAGTLSVFLECGIPITEAIPAVAQAIGNRAFRAAIFDLLPVVRAGGTLAEGLRRSGKLLPEMVLALVEVSEQAGSLSKTLKFLASYHEREADQALKAMTTALEPLLLIVVGLIVGVFAYSIITPLYEVTGSIA